jgi:membrane protease YdiL (CAAX protease family)
MSASRAFFNPATGVLRAGWRILWLVAWVVPFYFGMGMLARFTRAHLAGPALLTAKALHGALFILGCLWIYRSFARVVEHRMEFPELRIDGDTPRHAGLGFLFGGGAMLLIVAILALAGSYHVEATTGLTTLLRALFLYLPQTFLEDFLFCLILFRLIKEGLGRSAALLVAPVLFSLAHMGNEHESMMGLLEIFTSGVLMYYAFDRTGSFFAAWGLHLSWNFTMNGVFGLANSGQDLPGFIRSRVTGPTWFTGGATGPEASVLAVGLDLLFILLLWKASERVLKPRAA